VTHPQEPIDEKKMPREGDPHEGLDHPLLRLAHALAFEDVAKPEIAAHEVLVHVRAASLNPYDWRYLHAP
jgi:hypothetical protein